MVSSARSDKYRIHRGWEYRCQVRTRAESSFYPPRDQRTQLDYMYHIPNSCIDIFCQYRILRLDDRVTDSRSMRADYHAESSTTRTSVTSIWIRTVTRKYCITFYSIPHRTTHTVHCDAMVRIDEWSRDIRWMVGYHSRPRDGTRICRGWTHRTHRDTHSIHDTELQKSLPFISGRVVTSCWIPRLSRR